MAVEGSLDLFQLPEILQVVSQQNKTGILTIQGADDIVAVSFLNGRIVAADSLTETTEKGVGEVLLADGAIDAQALRRLTDQSVQDGSRLGDLLVSGGSVDREQFLTALRIHTLQLLMSLLEWQSGEFKFYGGDEVSYEEGFRAIGVDELLLRAIEESEKPDRQALPEPTARLARAEVDRPIQVREVDDLDEQLFVSKGDTIYLTPEEDRVLQQVSADRTVEEVSEAAGVPLDRARYVLFRLSRDGVVEPAGLAQAPAEAVPEAPGFESPGPEEILGETAVPSPATLPPELAVKPARRPAVRDVEMPTPEQRAESLGPPQPKRRPRRAGAPGQGLPMSGVLALVLLALVLIALLVAPAGLLTPFPWLEEERSAFGEGRDLALRLKIDQAAKSFFLLEGRFPDSLADLVERNLLDPSELTDARGHTLAYDSLDGTYEVRSMTDGAADEDLSETKREGIAGNFLLDPEFFGEGVGRGLTEAPLVLLD